MEAFSKLRTGCEIAKFIFRDASPEPVLSNSQKMQHDKEEFFWLFRQPQYTNSFSNVLFLGVSPKVRLHYFRGRALTLYLLFH